MKYSKGIVIFSLLALLLCVVCRYIFIVNDANIKEKQLAKALKNIKQKKKIITGKHLDLTKDNIKESEDSFFVIINLGVI